MQITFLPEKQLARNSYPYPVAPQEWHFRQAIDYIMTANYAILDLASRMSDTFLYNRYLMGRNNIEKGSRDHWTITPARIEAVKRAMEKDGVERKSYGGGRSDWGYPPEYYENVLHDPAHRDARGYIVTSDQEDFLTATKFVNVLIKSGIAVHQATESFDVAGKRYPAGSYVLKNAQAFRPHLRSMFEPQNHPDDYVYPGGPPNPPYDSAGWTLAFQMDVEFDSVFDTFDGPFAKLDGFAKPPAGEVKGEGRGYLLSHRVNDAFIATNRLLKDGEEIYWLGDSVEVDGVTFPPGTLYIPTGYATVAKLETLASEIGLVFTAVDAKPPADALRLRPVRIGISEPYGGSSTAGWTRWLLEQFEFPYESVYPQTLDAGNLKNQFDVLIFETGAITAETDRAGNRREPPKQPDAASLPEKYRERLGHITKDKTIPQLEQFMKSGGTIVAIGSSTTLAYDLGLPLTDALIDPSTGKALPMEKYWAPGSVHRLRLDNSHPLAYGLPEQVDIYFNKNPVFRTLPDAVKQGVHTVGWFDSAETLRSGWALGEAYHKGGITVVDAKVGAGRLVLLTPLVNFRGQSHGSFKFLFNGIYYGSAETMEP